jgi:ferrous iron transport protein B
LKEELARPLNGTVHPALFEAQNVAGDAIGLVQQELGDVSNYTAYQLLQQYRINDSLSDSEKEALSGIESKTAFNNHELRKTETIFRYRAISEILERTVTEKKLFSETISDKLDAVLTHRVWGYVIFLSVLFLIFQAIFAWATVPMDFIDMVFSQLGSALSHWLPAGVLTNLITEGIIPGIGGIVIFIPQIAILFAFIGILEETGYMARVVFLMDKIMRKFGLNGRSVVPLISGVACAIPAIMATRTIDSWKERLITIFVTPFMSCSARLPVYTILIALIIPENPFYQGLALMTMYLLGLLAAVLSAWVMKLILKTRDRSFLIMELPTYKLPRATNILLIMYEKSRAFVLEAGKIILAISIILWVLASYGPGDEMENAAASVTQEHPELTGEPYEQAVESYKLEHSYAGHFGKFIEPVIKPLGYDWKIGIALITSFAAREVFVGTMATIYSIGNTDDEATIKTRMKREINAETGEPRYDMATGWSLLIFYAFAMQCMSTLAIVQKETQSWRWPLLQLVFMTGLAYLSSFAIYQVLS